MNLILSGPSGAGKGTLISKLLSDYSTLKKSVSYTTRKPREGEKCGKDHVFVDINEFDRLIKCDFFFEYTFYDDNFYGIPNENTLDDENIVLFDLVASSGKKIKDKNPNSKLVYVITPDFETLKKRRDNRGDNRSKYDANELEIAKKEYDYLIINSDINLAYLNLLKVINGSYGKIDDENIKFLSEFFCSNIKESHENKAYCFKTV